MNKNAEYPPTKGGRGKRSQRAVTAIEIAVVVGFLLVVCTGGTLVYISRILPKQRVKQVNADLRSAQVAIEGFFVDNCSELQPAPGNFLPFRLTTPIGYLKTLPVDPFSPKRETFRYFNQVERANGTMYVVASRGPDGDWDISQLPERHSIARKCLLSGTVRMKTIHDKTANSNTFTSPAWCEDLEYYIGPDGKRIDVPKFEITVLPKDPKSQGWLSKPALVEYFRKHNVAIYDPTNGVKSDGDIIRTNSR